MQFDFVYVWAHVSLCLNDFQVAGTLKFNAEDQVTVTRQQYEWHTKDGGMSQHKWLKINQFELNLSVQASLTSICEQMPHERFRKIM